MKNITRYRVLLTLLMVPLLLCGQDLNRPFGWASLNGGTTGSGITELSQVTATTPNVYRPTTETEFAAAISAAKTNATTTIIIPANTTISFAAGQKIDQKAKNISILGEPGARFDSPSGEAGILNIRGRNVIIRNIIFTGPGAVDVNGADLLGIEGGENVWVDHCDFSDGIDGNLDIKGGANYITVSWCKFYYTAKSTGHKYSNLLGHSDSASGSDKNAMKITLALNWWSKGITERMPRVRFGAIHCVNNLYNSPGNNYCIRAGMEANIYVDQNAFVGVKDPITNNVSKGVANPCFVTMNEADNYYENCTGTLAASGLLNNSGALFNPYNEYDYTPVPKEKVAAIVSNSSAVEGYQTTTGAGATLWSNVKPGTGEEINAGGSTGGNTTAGVSFFGETAPANDYFWFNEDNSAVVEALYADGSITGSAKYQKTKNDGDKLPDLADKTGAIVVNKTGGDAIFKLSSCGTFKLYLVRTGSFSGEVFVSTDGANWGEKVREIIGAKGKLELDCSAEVASATPVYIRVVNNSTGGMQIYGADIRLAGEQTPEEEEEEEIIDTPKMADVWDFGAEQLDETAYVNQLNVDVMNGWYGADVVAGSAGVNFAETFTVGKLKWQGGKNDRLRTSNELLTRYDANVGSADFKGRLYINASARPDRRFTIQLEEDDNVSVFASSQNGTGMLHFVNTTDNSQDDETLMPATVTEFKFAAKNAGEFALYDAVDKPSYYRIVRSSATYITISGQVAAAEGVELPSGWGVVFTNTAGKEWKAKLEGMNYSARVPAGYEYEVSLSNAPGYLISGNAKVNAESAATLNITVTKIALSKVSGKLIGLPEESFKKVTLRFTPSVAKEFVPQPTVSADGSYSVELEPNTDYIVSAEGVNDYYIPSDKIMVTGSQAIDISFEAKPRYQVNLTLEGLSAEQKASARVTFSNINEEGYVYAFAATDAISLREGNYAVACTGLDKWPLALALTANLKVEKAAVEKTLTFAPVRVWNFNDKQIASGETAYNGLLFTGNVKNEVAKGHLLGVEGATIKVPVKAKDKLTVTFYYSANFTIEGGAGITTTNSTGSTNKTDVAEYEYTGTADGYVTLTFGAGTTYIKRLALATVTPYAEEIRVGASSEYQSLNAALEAVRNMKRTSNQRVKILVEPGNYEEMLVVDVPNVSLVNAAATPSIALKNKGVEIDENAVRVTSYYGHGYSYYSMGTDQKWNADVLRVNKENGMLSYVNKGSGNTNGSYWNATVVIAAEGFEAHDIIFENSFNQYISKKESEDVVVEWETGGKGTRPVTFGDTGVQNKKFVERAAAVAVIADKAVFNRCRIIGRQDTFYGSAGNRVAIYKGVVMGACDYIFGGMTAVFYQTELAMNTSEDKNDVTYITAAQQNGGRGYLMYECTINSAKPGTETASENLSKPGYFGRPWQPKTSEVVFFNTTIDKTDFPGSEEKSLILPQGWNNSLGGESEHCYEYGTKELSGEDNRASRAAWANIPVTPVLKDGTEITAFNFTKGSDGWNPIKVLADIETSISVPVAEDTLVRIFVEGSELYVEGFTSEAVVQVYAPSGMLAKSLKASSTVQMTLPQGLWIVKVMTSEGVSTAKVMIRY